MGGAPGIMISALVSRFSCPGSSPGACFSKSPKTFRATESHSTMSNLMMTWLFYSHILDMNTVSFHTRGFRGIHISGSVLHTGELKMDLYGPKQIPGFRETAPGRGHCVVFLDKTLNWSHRASLHQGA